ncbi:hypothetical protein [Luteimonas mephitis]|uniref:hypothetical protein n=1 Tax=Luteimonas mephitis TaxID=83615 RepID=UPI0012EC0D24|nr:hypothetical protein [Luteimonas mephitis]
MMFLLHHDDSGAAIVIGDIEAMWGLQPFRGMVGAPGANALRRECPPASASGRRLLLEFAPKGIRTRRPDLDGGSKGEKAGSLALSGKLDGTSPSQASSEEKKAGPKARIKERETRMEVKPGSGATRLLRRAGGVAQYAMFCDQYASICVTSSSGSGT